MMQGEGIGRGVEAEVKVLQVLEADRGALIDLDKKDGEETDHAQGVDQVRGRMC